MGLNRGLLFGIQNLRKSSKKHVFGVAQWTQYYTNLQCKKNCPVEMSFDIHLFIYLGPSLPSSHSCQSLFLSHNFQTKQ